MYRLQRVRAHGHGPVHVHAYTLNNTCADHHLYVCVGLQAAAAARQQQRLQWPLEGALAGMRIRQRAGGAALSLPSMQQPCNQHARRIIMGIHATMQSIKPGGHEFSPGADTSTDIPRNKH